MKVAVTITRIFTGVLFIFSGLVKAIDPRGLAYKMQEFFEAWAHDGFFPKLMDYFSEYALSFSVLMISLEVIVGAALLFAWHKKLTTWVLLLLILFFTFLTGYVLFTGHIRTCGCFGDCIPLTPIQTFSKDLLLLAMIVFLLVNKKWINPIAKPSVTFTIILISTVLTLFLQYFVLVHLPLVDCLPYKKGNDIAALRKMPLNAVPDKYDYVFVYMKEGKKQSFTVAALPDSTWSFVERKQELIEKGKNNTPLINDFSFTTLSGNDTTEAILSKSGAYYVLYIKDVASHAGEWANDKQLIARLIEKNQPVFIVTSQRNEVTNKIAAMSFKDKTPLIFTCDGTAIKTAARANPVVFKMNGSIVEDKCSWADFNKLK